jgi:hypothetical protein
MASNQPSTASSDGKPGVAEDSTPAEIDHADSALFSEMTEFDFNLWTESEAIDISIDGLGTSFHNQRTYPRDHPSKLNMEWPAKSFINTQLHAY